MAYDTVSEIRTANRQRGYHFFDPGAMRFFNSRISEEVYGGKYFITSEQFDDRSPRLYTIRMVNDDASIDTIGDFQQYNTLAQAKGAIKRLIKEEQSNG